MKYLTALAALAALSACASRPAMVNAPPLPALEPPRQGWRAIASEEDAARLDGLPRTWQAALEAAAKFRRALAREGDLLAPEAARNHPAPPPGSYHCRLVKLGQAGRREAPYRGYPAFFCNVRGDTNESLFFTKQTGSELPSGWLHRDGEARRLILTGAKQPSGNGTSLVYGEDAASDLVGVVERIGPFRWRIVMPWRGETPGLDIYELTPVALEQQAAEPLPALERTVALDRG
ncbi:DUF4893 domain-containing protein [Sphingobium lignivorans]|uniref:DUF4893 domain-containing protein n=1 Tax=Sphingobium lignivorans TaxID=2735886 RepID=A0ABR6NJ94_9SPHN|nr:DUF4893 domain-containing protein [Sphingobium lignivorans]MBB5987358.1 hypothetical protein [Sphingobium lignivorans]